jgi:anion-transporting  ArsA/GET3 family ATPase
VGPIRRQALKIHEFVTDARATGVVVVAMPEEMPVNETLEFEDRLRRELKMEVDVVVANGVYPERFTGAEASTLASLDGRGSAGARAALRAALAEHHWARAQRSQLRRLRGGTKAPVATLPYLFQPELSLDDLDGLSRELERKL